MNKKIVFLTGAGISAESGIKTFRDSDGLWENFNVEDVATISGWRRNKELVLEFYNTRRKQLDDVKPNLAHELIAEIEKDYDVNVITTNVDDLHEKAGSTNILHLHGELRKMCSSNNKELTLDYIDDIKLGDKHEDGSQLRPYIVWFGEDVPNMGKAIKLVREADIVVVVGTSLEVYPAANLVNYSLTDFVYYIDPKPAQVNYNVKVISKTATEGMRELIEILKQK